MVITMKKETLNEIVAVLIDHLKAAPDGYAVTTYLLLENAGYDARSFVFADLFEIHIALFEAAEEAGLILDMSKHLNKVEGLPFHLDFILRK